MLGRWLLLRERQYLQECMHHVLLDARVAATAALAAAALATALAAAALAAAAAAAARAVLRRRRLRVLGRQPARQGPVAHSCE